MSSGIRRLHNHLTNIDPLCTLIIEKGYRPRHHIKYKKLKYCIVCGKRTYKSNCICSDKCFKQLVKEKRCSFNSPEWYTDTIKPIESEVKLNV